HVCDLHGADAIATRAHSTRAEDADLPGDGTIGYAALTTSRTCPTISSIIGAVTSRWVHARMRPSIIASSTPRLFRAATILSPGTPAPSGLKNTRLVSGSCTSMPGICDR